VESLVTAYAALCPRDGFSHPHQEHMKYSYSLYSCLLICWLGNRNIWGWHPLPIAYSVSPYFGLAYCVPPFLASCTAYRLTTETTIFGVFIYTKWIKWQNVACTCTLFLKNVSFDVFACYIFQFYCSHKRSKRAKNLELFNFVCQFCCVCLWQFDLFKLNNDVCRRTI